jgi:glycosyltransferase involved in cell wall biosynthesis
MPLILLHSFLGLLILTLTKRIDILHCRSYPITWAAVTVKKLTGVRVVFDPRSDFPEENVTAGLWTENSRSHRAWKKLERRLLDESDATVAILDTYVRHFESITPDARLRVIPNNVSTDRFTRDEASRKAVRQDMAVTDGTIVFCYSGSLGTHWHDPGCYAKYIIGLRPLPVPWRFLFITADTAALENTLREYGVRQEEYWVVSSDFDDVPSYLSAADFGVILMERFKIAMGVKTVEYLSMGLPVITDRNTAGAQEVVDRYGVGLVIKDHERIDIKVIERLILQRDDLSLECRRIATERFSTTRVAAQYASLYDTLGAKTNQTERVRDNE